MSDKKKRRILVAVDGSEPSNRAVEFAVGMAAAGDALLHLVNVVDLRQIDVYDGFYLTDDQLETLEAKAREQILDQAEAKVPKGIVVASEVLRGNSVEELVGAAEGAWALVVGKTGRSAFDRLIEGSVSRALLSGSPVPLIVVP